MLFRSASNIKGNDLDSAIVAEIKSMYENKTKIMEYLAMNEKDTSSLLDKNQVDCKKIESQIAEKEMSIKNLIKKLSQTTSETIEKYIEQEITELDNDNNALRLKLQALEDNITEHKSGQLSSEITKDALLKFSTQFDSADLIMKRNLLKTIIKDITWNGDKIKINMYAKLDGD